MNRIARYSFDRVVHNAAVIPSNCTVKNDTWMTRWISRKFDTVGQNRRVGGLVTDDAMGARAKAINKVAFVCERRISDDYRSRARVIFT